jgi:RimJ/RimL family protein N-acetyltransferase
MLQGKTVILRPAKSSDSRSIYEWLAHSDLTSSMLGPPLFPEVPAPTWEQFCAEYPPHFFDGSRSDVGRSFIIEVNGFPVGHINYDGLDSVRRCAELDIWLRSSECCGKGYGSDAIDTLVIFLQEKYQVKKFILRPSQRNTRAIKSYKRAGFKIIDISQDEQLRIHGPGDYTDNVFMMRKGVA